MDTEAFEFLEFLNPQNDFWDNLIKDFVMVGVGTTL